MPVYNFGGAERSATSYFPPVRTKNVPLPTDREASDGRRYMLITELGAWLSNDPDSTQPGLRGVRLFLGAAQSLFWTVPKVRPAPYVSIKVEDGGLLVDQGEQLREFVIEANGPVSFGLRPGGESTEDADYTRWAGVIGGSATYLLPPEAPTIDAAWGSGTSVTVSVGMIGDDGGSPVTGFVVTQATDEAFTENVRSVTINAEDNAVFTGGQPNTTYYHRAVAQNAVTDEAEVSGGAWSATVAHTLPPVLEGLGVIYVGSEERPLAGQIFTGENWADADGVIFDGTNWVPIGI